MKRLTIVMIWLFGFISFINAQSTKITQAAASQNLESIEKGIAMRPFDNRYEGVQGSPFIFDDWMDASLWLADRREFANLKLKIDAYQGEVIVSQNNNAIVVSDPVQEIYILATQQTFMSAKSIGLNESGFVEVLSSGELKFFAKRWKKLIPADYQGAYAADRTYDKYVDKTDYYYRIKDKSTEKLKLKKKTIEGVYPIKGKEYKKLIENLGVDLTTEKGVSTLFDYYNNKLSRK